MCGQWLAGFAVSAPNNLFVNKVVTVHSSGCRDYFFSVSNVSTCVLVCTLNNCSVCLFMCVCGYCLDDSLNYGLEHTCDNF